MSADFEQYFQKNDCDGKLTVFVKNKGVFYDPAAANAWMAETFSPVEYPKQMLKKVIIRFFILYQCGFK
jgi:hypothetical protein